MAILLLLINAKIRNIIEVSVPFFSFYKSSNSIF